MCGKVTAPSGGGVWRRVLTPGRKNMREAGFEPTTSASGGQRSIQLSYSRRSTAEKREACRPAGAVASFLMRTPKVPVPPHLNKDSSATLSCQLDSARRVREAVSLSSCRIALNDASQPAPFSMKILALLPDDARHLLERSLMATQRLTKAGGAESVASWLREAAATRWCSIRGSWTRGILRS